LFRSAGEDLSARREKKERKTRYNMVASMEEKKRKEFANSQLAEN
jgi:hypothetical protein